MLIVLFATLICIICAVYFIVKVKKERKYYPQEFGHDVLDAICGIYIVSYAVLLIVFGIWMVDKGPHWQIAMSEYNNLQEQAKTCYYDNTLDKNNIRVQVLDMNNRIDRNKAYANNPWWGIFYNEDFGNLPHLYWNGEMDTDFD